MPKITNTEYKEFYTTGLIHTVEKEAFKDLLDNVSHKNTPQARALFIILYYSGRRPVEIANLKPEDIQKEGRYLRVIFSTKKGGRATYLYLPFDEYIQEFYKYAKTSIPGAYIFYLFRSKAVKTVKWRSKLKGEVSRVYPNTNDKISKFVKKWTGRPAYWFRHNRMSILAIAGASDRELMFFKGAKDFKSIMPYVHLSKEVGQKISRKYFK